MKYRQINQWLLNEGMLYLYDFGGRRPVKRPTKEENRIGIILESRMGRYGEYQVVLYNEEAQRFVVDNLDAIAATEAKRGKSYDNAASDAVDSDS